MSNFLKQHISAKRQQRNQAHKANSIDARGIDKVLSPVGRIAAASHRYNNQLIEKAAKDIHEVRSGLRSQDGSVGQNDLVLDRWNSQKSQPHTINPENRGQILTDRRATVANVAARRYMSQRLARKRDSEAK